MKNILHIDVNSAFLSWTALELLRNGYPKDVREIPSAIAGDPKNRHGIILAKSTPAKKYGIQTAMPLSEAMKRCPFLEIFPPSHDLYSRCSNAMFNLLSEYSSNIERFSIDECWMDYTGSEKLFGKPMEAAIAINSRVKSELGFTVNIGISTNKLLAKMASEFEKPDKIHTLYPDEIETKMWPLPVSELFGVGRSSRKQLEKININTIGELAKTEINILRTHFKPIFAQMLYERANGIDESPVVSRKKSETKSIGNSVTTPKDIETEEEAFNTLLALSTKTGERIRAIGAMASIVSVQLKNKDFYTYQHQKKLFKPTSSTDAIYEIAQTIFKEMWKGDALRLIGITLSGISFEFTEQLSLFGEQEYEEASVIDEVTDKINERFGDKSLIRGTLIQHEE